MVAGPMVAGLSAATLVAPAAKDGAGTSAALAWDAGRIRTAAARPALAKTPALARTKEPGRRDGAVGSVLEYLARI